MSINRCQHIKVNGTQCGSPALRGERICYFHHQFQEQRIRLGAERARGRPDFVLPVLEDAESIQVSLMQVIQMLATGQLDAKTASLILYALQTASTNLRHANFQPYKHNVVVDPATVAATPLDGHVWRSEDFHHAAAPGRRPSLPPPKPPQPAVISSPPVAVAQASPLQSKSPPPSTLVPG
jgi:hypothetical protein